MMLDTLLAKRTAPVCKYELRNSEGVLLAIIGPTTFFDAIETAALLRPTGKMVDLRAI